MVQIRYIFLKAVFIVYCYNFVVANKAQVYNIKRCNENTYYPVIVNNVSAEETNGHIFVSGSLSSDNDLTAPITASLTVKRYIKWSQVWIEIACIGGIGSCTYNDLCSYGISQNKSCPTNFVKNDVPCRCPISKGTYTMNPDNKINLFSVPKRVYLLGNKFGTPVAGIYWVQVEVRSKNNLLSCYEVYINYNDESESDNFEDNEILPTVELVF